MLDVLAVEGDIHDGEPLIHEVMAGGRRIGPHPTLAEIRVRAQHELGRLPAEPGDAGPLVPYPVEVAASLRELATVADRRTGLREVKL